MRLLYFLCPLHEKSPASRAFLMFSHHLQRGFMYGRERESGLHKDHLFLDCLHNKSQKLQNYVILM